MTMEKGRETSWQAGSAENPAYQRTAEMISFSELLGEKKENTGSHQNLRPIDRHYHHNTIQACAYV